MRSLRLLALLLLAGIYGVPGASADEAARRSSLQALYNSGDVNAERFAQSFLDQVPAARLSIVLRQLKTTYGAASRVSGEDGKYVLWTGRYRIPVQFTHDPRGRIVGLFFKPGIVLAQRIRTVTDLLDRLPGQSAYLIVKNGTPLAARDADRALAVGSAFKLAVLFALRRTVESGDRAWSSVIRIAAPDRSLPSGILQNFPSDAPVTLHTAAALMIAKSDNTATDTLIRTLGRSAVEAVAGLMPLLTTREFFQLKADRDLYARYVRADLKQRRRILSSLAGRALPAGGQAFTALQEHVEWHIPLNRLCRWMGQLHDLDVMHINPGVADPSRWQRVAYKGGSEIGVINLTTWLSDSSGNSYCIATTWNDAKPLDRQRMFQIYASLIDVVRRRHTSYAKP